MEQNLPIDNNDKQNIFSMKYEQENKTYQIKLENINASLLLSIKNEKDNNNLYQANLTIQNFYEMNKILRFCIDINEVIEFLKEKIENKEVKINEKKDIIIFEFSLVNQFGDNEQVEIKLTKEENFPKKVVNTHLKNEVAQLKQELAAKDREFKQVKELYDGKLRTLRERLKDISEHNLDWPYTETRPKKMADYPYYNPRTFKGGEDYEFKTYKLLNDLDDAFYGDNEPISTLGAFRFINGPNYEVINGNIAIKTSDGIWDATVLGDRKLAKNERNSFKIRINKEYFGGGIMVGIAQSDIKQKLNNNHESDKVLCLSTWTLETCIKGKWNKYGEGRLKDGDIVEVIADLKKKTLEFEVNGINLGIAYDNLTYKKYLPFIEMHNRGNEIELLESKIG